MAERVAIVGSRDYPYPARVIQCVLDIYADNPQTTIISGGASGPDTWAATTAYMLNMPRIIHYPDWYKRKSSNPRKHGQYNPAAGLERNNLIVKDCDRVIAFWDSQSKGTKDTMDKARKAKKPVEIIREEANRG